MQKGLDDEDDGGDDLHQGLLFYVELLFVPAYKRATCWTILIQSILTSPLCFSFSELPAVGPVTPQDIEVALKNTRPSAHLRAHRYEQFNDDYGSQIIH